MHLLYFDYCKSACTSVCALPSIAAGAAMTAVTPVPDAWEHDRVAGHVQKHGYSRITLQFPDELLQHASTVAQELQQLLLQRGSTAKVYVLADTSYNPLSIDEVAAAHVKADCVVHYGYASLHPVSRTPALCVLPKQQLDVQDNSIWLIQQLARLHDQVKAGTHLSTPTQQQQQQQEEEGPVCVICCDQSYLHQVQQLQQAVLQGYQGPLQLVFAQSAPTELWPQATKATAAAAAPSAPDGSAANCSMALNSSSSDSRAPEAAAQSGDEQTSQSGTSAPVPVGGLVWQLPVSSSSSSGPVHMVWLGPAASPALTHLQLSYASRPWLLLDPVGRGIAEGLSPDLERLLKRRYYLVERARGAAMVGVLVGTLGAAGYKTALEQLRHLAAKAGKKTYTLLMGKPNPAKLANFPELEVFVMLADPQGLILDSKEYLRPIITPHEAFLAFTGRDFDAARYRLDFADLLQLELQGSSNSMQPLPACGCDVGGNITEIDGSDSAEAEAPGEGVDVQQLSSAAGALIIAGNGHSQALTGNKAGQQIQVQSAAQYLTQRRSYQGLETPATGAAILPAAVAVQGRSGRAAGYEDEPQH